MPLGETLNKIRVKPWKKHWKVDFDIMTAGLYSILIPIRITCKYQNLYNLYFQHDSITSILYFFCICLITRMFYYWKRKAMHIAVEYNIFLFLFWGGFPVVLRTMATLWLFHQQCGPGILCPGLVMQIEQVSLFWAHQANVAMQSSFGARDQT